jgi:hypothetical protein
MNPETNIQRVDSPYATVLGEPLHDLPKDLYIPSPDFENKIE